MAHTFRNKTSVPAGWTVRDDGHPYFNGDDRWGRKAQEARNEDVPWRAATKGMPRYRRSIYRCERTWYRRVWNREYRAQSNHLVRTGRWEDLLPPRRTSGWMTW